ncbi:MAG TPA: aconitate hydratase AcnA, partial [Candidatus Glassbacteria bacterium]|nr:aconitate hydratase AcnA [Candidatus Glassbacteria bacterium]
GPKRPQDRIPLRQSKTIFNRELGNMTKDRTTSGRAAVTSAGGKHYELTDGAVVIAAITSCTNTSNPSVMIGAGLVAKKAHEKGLKVKPWVKTSLGPGSLVVRDYLDKAGLSPHLDTLGFNIVGYGCTTCIGNSGPLQAEVSQAIAEGKLIAASVLSGNRNFEGRIHAEVKMNFLASPPLVVVYAIAGTMNIDLYQEPLGQDQNGKDVFLKDIWPSQREIDQAITSTINSGMFRNSYANVFAGDARWAAIQVEESSRYAWDNDSTYIQNPPYFRGMSREATGFEQIRGARVLAKLGDSITTDHISPAGSIKADSPAGKFLIGKGVKPADFNSYGSRRGNHEVMMRGTFANIRLRNQLAPGTEGGWTCFQPSGEQMSIYDASMKYQQAGTTLIILAGKEYGTGSSRDWAAKGTILLGVKAVLSESFERIHRSNLVGMGVLPLNYQAGDTAETLGLTGKEVYDIEGLVTGAREVTVVATSGDGKQTRFQAVVRVDTPKEWDYFNNGGILHYVLRQLAG